METRVSTDRPTILVVDDDPLMRLVICSALSVNQYQVLEAASGQDAIAALKSLCPDAILLELSLPDMDSVDFIRTVRQVTSTPIIVLSNRASAGQKGAALDAGATDYLNKPFSVEDLRSQLCAVLRPNVVSDASSSKPHVTFGDLCVDLSAGRVCLLDQELHLTRLEFRLLTVLITNAGRLLTYRFLIDEFRDCEQIRDIAALEILAYGLRHKIEPDPIRPRYLLTELGVGYRFSINQGDHGIGDFSPD
jgi:two-component system KDP operon response regulator KdpE